MSKNRVQVTYLDGRPPVDVVMQSELVPAYLAPLKASGVYLGTSRGGRLDKHIDGVLTLVARIAVTDPPRDHDDYPHEAGYLYGCAACESGPCVCAFDPGAAPCVSYACTNTDER